MTSDSRVRKLSVLGLVFLLAAAPPSTAQAQETEPLPHQHHHEEAAAPAWSWTSDFSVFITANYQQRKFTDFSTFESQNWVMLGAARPLGRGRLTIDGMVSLEPFTVQGLGSPQVFQTGESFEGAPLIDRQHPHDLLMQLSGRYRLPWRRVTFITAGGLVGDPALGPVPFMHRESARDNLQAPLGHHDQDSTHATPGFVTVGVQAGRITLEGSAFRGQEPDDTRTNIERPWLDSWSARGSWAQGPWRVQVSGGRIRRPEPLFDLYDVTRLTASIEFDGSARPRPFSIAVIWGENRESHGVLDGYLVEWEAAVHRNGRVFGRAESVAKDILGLGTADPPGFSAFHPVSHIQALTLGYVRDIRSEPWGRVSIGADVSVYRISDELVEPYGSPHSFHIFLHYRPRISVVHAH